MRGRYFTKHIHHHPACARRELPPTNGNISWDDSPPPRVPGDPLDLVMHPTWWMPWHAAAVRKPERYVVFLAKVEECEPDRFGETTRVRPVRGASQFISADSVIEARCYLQALVEKVVYGQPRRRDLLKATITCFETPLASFV